MVIILKKLQNMDFKKILLLGLSYLLVSCDTYTSLYFENGADKKIITTNCGNIYLKPKVTAKNHYFIEYKFILSKNIYLYPDSIYVYHQNNVIGKEFYNANTDGDGEITVATNNDLYHLSFYIDQIKLGEQIKIINHNSFYCETSAIKMDTLFLKVNEESR